MSPEISLVPAIKDDEFALFQSLIHRASGISLATHKKPLLVSRLFPRLRTLGLQSFSAYYRHVTAPDGGEELQRMIDCVCTNETRFFREPAQFDFLSRTLLPTWNRGAPRRIRVLSAACSTGEEPYSVAMTLLYHLTAPGLSFDVLAADLSTRALEHARRAIWPLERAAEIPTEYLHAFMLRGKDAQHGNMKVGPEIRRLVSFHHHNLCDPARPALGHFDLIFCRNVLIYFDAETRAAVLARLLGSLNPTGYLFLGHAESLGGSTDRVEAVMPSVYRFKAAPKR